ncbi:ATP/GTP-binding protein [Streptomyces olivaceoviridis]
MSDESGESEGRLINFPVGSDVTDRPPQLPDPGRLFPGGNEGSEIPPESPEETTMELPPIPTAPRPESALASDGVPLAEVHGETAEEVTDGEYFQSRSLADRLGDWLELRIEMARERHASEAPFREAEIARKAALLEARTAQETAMMEQNAKLHNAQMKAKADKAAARGKADAARSSSSGMGADKGGRSKAGGGGGGSRGGGGSSGGSGRGGTGGGRGSGTNGSGGTGRGSGGGNSPKGTGKGSDRSAGGRGGGSKGNESSGGPKGRQNGSGGSGAGNSGAGKGSSGGSKGDGGRTQNSPASSSRAERARGRQERAAARQAARQQRRSNDQAANLADRSKDRDQDRANRQAEREQRRAAKAERKAARKAKREAAKAAEDRTTLGEAVAEEAQRRWDKRRAAEKDKAAQDDRAKDSSSDKDSEAATKKMPKDGPDSASDGSKDGSAAQEPDDGKKAGEKPSDGSSDKDAKDGTGTGDGPKPNDVKDPPGTDNSDDGRSFKEKLKDFFTKAGEDTTPPEPEEPSTLRPEDRITVDRPGGPPRSTKTEAAEEDIPDAVIVEDASDPFGAYVHHRAGLPPAPEPHTQRPGTTRPTAQEDSVASPVRKASSGQVGLAAKHRTDITFDEYLVAMTNIAFNAGADMKRAQELAVALRKVAVALRSMATDLVNDHNIDTEVTELVADIADAAELMQRQAQRTADQCGEAFQAARLVAAAVGRTYGEDIQAMDDAGLAHASAAAHHD